MRSARWFWVPVALISLLSLVLCFVPLFNLLGYEFAFALGIAAAVTGMVIGLGAARERDDGVRPLGLALVLAAAQLAPALTLISLNALRVQNCNFGTGLGYFALLPLPSSLYGASLGVLVGQTLRGGTRTLRALAAVTLLGAALGMTLWTLYYEPPIFAFDHAFGHFAGSLYDEVIRLDVPLLVFRVGTLLRIALIALVLAAWARRPGGAARALVVCAAGLVGLVLFETKLGPAFGFRVSRRDILAVLSDTETRAGLVIHLPRGLDARVRGDIADDHAFRLAQVQERLGVTSGRTIHSFVYPNAAVKARLMGGHGTMIAKPWLFEIHIHDAGAPHAVMAHELVHVVAGELAPGPLHVTSNFGLFVNMGLVEGVAEAIEPARAPLAPEAWAAAMRHLHLAPDMRRLLGSAGFWSEAPRRAYTVAGAFVGYLLRTRGAAPLRQAYAHGDFATAYGMPLDSLVDEWEAELDRVTLTPFELRLAEEEFRTPAIFARPCAHEIAALREQAARAAPAEAVELERRIAGFLNDSPRARLDLAFALRRAHDDRGFAREAEALLTLPEALLATERARLLEARGEMHWQANEPALARADFSAVLDLHLGSSSDRLQWVRLWALAAPSEVAQAARDLLLEQAPTLAAVLELAQLAHDLPSDRTLPYLVGRQLVRVQASALAARFLERAAGHPFPAIEAERVRLLAECEAALQEFATAAGLAARYAELAPTSGERTYALDERARLAYLAALHEGATSAPTLPSKAAKARRP